MESVFIDERQDIQKKTFTKWINGYLAKSNTVPINDLFMDLRDGHKLLTLLEVLTNQTYKREKGCMRVHHINNLNKALEVLKECGVKLVNISSDDINSGNAKLTLGLIWLIALSFDGQKLVNSQAKSGIEKSLLNWVRQFVTKHGIKVNDFSASWSDGSAFLAILSETIDSLDLKAALKKHPIARLRLAFDLAYQHLSIEQLLDPEDVNTHKPDKKSILMYVMCLYNAIDSRKLDQRVSMENLVHHVESMEEIQLVLENDESNLKCRNSNFLEKKSDSATQNEEPITGHSRNYMQLDDISLAKSIDDLSHFNSDNKFANPMIQIEHTETVNSNFKLTSTMAMPSVVDTIQWDLKSSRPISTATNFSAEFSAYQSTIEEVLTMLLEAEEIFSNETVISDLNDAKAQFHDHEAFMAKLSEYQTFVCGALEEGSRLIKESQTNPGTHGLDQEGQNEIKQQLFLLNERWEILRVNALERQSNIHKQLAKIQMEKVDNLKKFLTNIEDRISHMQDVGSNLIELKAQIEEHKQLQNEMKAQEKLVQNLSNLVIIIDSDNFCDFEDKLTALEERWSHLTKWIANRWEKLQTLSQRWTRLSEQYRIIYGWIKCREHNLKKMETNESVEIGAIMEGIKRLQYCKHDINVLSKCLQQLEIAAQSLTDEGYSTLDVSSKIENLCDLCDALKQILEAQEVRVENMGFKIPSCSVEREQINFSKPDSWEDFQLKMSEETEKDTTGKIEICINNLNHTEFSPQAGKKRKNEEPLAVVRLNEFLYELRCSFNEFTSKISNLKKMDLQDRIRIIKDIEASLATRKSEYNKARELYDECNDLAGISLEIEYGQLTELNELLDSYEQTLDELRMQKKTFSVKDNFYKSLMSLKLILADTRDWYQQNASKVAMVDLKKRLFDMVSLQNEIDEKRQLTETNIGDDWIELRNDFELFFESWNDLKISISRIIVDNASEVIQQMQSLRCHIKNHPIIYSDLETMNLNLKKIDLLKSSYNTLNDEGVIDLLIQVSYDSTIDQVGSLCAEIPQLINDAIIKQNIAIENFKHFNAEYANIIKLLEKLEISFGDDLFIPGEIQTLQFKHSEYDQYLMDLKKVEIDIISINNFSEIIL